MFEYIRGILSQSSPSSAVIEAGGIGYRIVIGLSTFTKMPKAGSQLALFLSFIVKEDSQTLYGFFSIEEREFFEKLLAVNGIGPKTAIGLLGHLDMPELQLAIAQGNAQLLAKAPGIGKKTAERIVMELRDKIKKMSLPLLQAAQPSISKTAEDAISALINLGYQAVAAQKAVNKVLENTQQELDLPRLISLSLRSI